ncbi:extracellular solute-binding protein [Glycomyces xiaoerkulensis]|uniref:extracellular solute-binding protein n=1 Tax=Glycomyces xiaoerkulensis TaxID=2038139 RepID=UPI000C2680C6|nr:extracellular solute-binding protein [Glycomyces xiaoerkulensis]
MRKPLNRLRALTAAGAAGALALTAACGGSGGSNDDEITWWHIQNEDPMMSYWDQLSEEWLEESGSDLTFDTQAIENDSFKQRLSVSESADEMPDLFQTWGGGVLAEQAEAGLVRDLTDELDCLDLINPGYLEAYTVDGRVYGVPFDAGAVGFWYNKDLFAEAGIDEIPETWSGFLGVVEDLKAADITPIALGESELWPGHFYWAYLVMRTIGLDALSESAANMEFSDPGFVEAGEHLQDLIELEPFQPGFEAAPYGEGPDSQAAIMGNGDAAMELMGQWAPSVQADSSGTDGLGDSLGFFKFPAVEGGAGDINEILSGGNGFAVGNNAPDEVFDYLCYLFSEENQSRILENADGLFTTVAANPENVLDEVDPHLQLVLDTVAESTGAQLYLDQDYPAAVGETVNEATGGLFLGDIGPEQVVEDINTAWEREQ